MPLMWPWSRSTPLSPRLIRFDMHNHLLPGVDDGVRSRDQAFEAVGVLREMGYSGAVITPHINRERYDNSEADLLAHFGEFEEAARERAPGFRLQLGAEYRYDELLLDRLFDDPGGLLQFGHGMRHLLVELPVTPVAPSMDVLLDECARLDIRPVVAHIERYPSLQGPSCESHASRWREHGALLQVNLGSFAGQYGRRSRTAAATLWKAGLVDMLGTDMHRPQGAAGVLDRAWRYLSSHTNRAGFDPNWHEGLFVEMPGGATSRSSG